MKSFHRMQKFAKKKKEAKLSKTHNILPKLRYHVPLDMLISCYGAFLHSYSYCATVSYFFSNKNKEGF